MTTGEKLQQLRKENNYTQEKLADIMNVSRQSISKWESDVAFPETEKLITLSKLYKCSIDYLLNNENDNPTTGTAVAKKNGYNKKRLPLIMTTISSYLLILFFFLPTWFTGFYTRYDLFVDSSGTSYLIDAGQGEEYFAAGLYDFFGLIRDVFTNSMAIKAMAIILFAFAIIIIHLCIVYLFLDKKPFNTLIKIANCVFLFGLLILLALAFSAHDQITWMPTPFIVLSLSVLQVILQYVVKPIRVTR